MDDAAHRIGVHRVVTGNGNDSGAIRHDNVLALTDNAKSPLLQGSNSVQMVDAGDLAHGLYTATSISRI